MKGAAGRTTAWSPKVSLKRGHLSRGLREMGGKQHNIWGERLPEEGVCPADLYPRPNHNPPKFPLCSDGTTLLPVAQDWN